MTEIPQTPLKEEESRKWQTLQIISLIYAIPTNLPEKVA
jgi:hypothetical protein